MISGRELGTGERWFRGVLAPLDIIPGAAALKKLSGVARVTSFAGDLGKLGKTTAQSSIRKVNDLSIAAGKVVDETITSTKNVLSNLMPASEFAFAGGAVKQSIENTHVTVNAVKYMVIKIEGLNIGGKKIKGKFGFDSTSELKGFDKQISKELENII